MLKKMIEQLNQELGAEEGKLLCLDKKGAYCIFLEEDIDVEIKELKESILLKSKIGSLPKEEGTFLLKALEANLFGVGTKHAVIGLEENVLTLSHELDYNISYESFKEKLEEFINILHYWRITLAS